MTEDIDDITNVEEELNVSDDEISDEHEATTEFRCTAERCRSYTHKFKSKTTYKTHLK